MILDALDAGVAISRRAQIAIVGAGPVGLTLARELAGCADVLLIESGGLQPEGDYEALNIGDCIGLRYPLTETRTRRIGGSTALWAGYCAPFDAFDFVPRPWVPHSGWPFGLDALNAYYRRSARFLNIRDGSFEADDLARRSGIALPFADDAIRPSAWRFGSPTLRLDEEIRSNPSASITAPTLIHATVVDIRLDADHAAVSEVIVRTMNGREGRIAADEFVLACGGIETARLLLNADSQQPHGIGNAHDLVGRYFMEHPHLPIATLELEGSKALEGFLERRPVDGGGDVLFNVGLAAEVQEDARLLNSRAHVYRTPAMAADDHPRIGIFMEQAPNPASRLHLSPHTDALGLRRIVLDWQLTDLERSTYHEAGELYRRSFAALGVGRVTSCGWRYEADQILYSNHHLGTTRMADSPTEGVVDADGRVHGISNLHIMGGGIYPTVSWANPTLTLMALTFRLADRVRRSLSAVDTAPGNERESDGDRLFTRRVGNA
jgi:choline dehydrogenase-like flavoprotein